MAEQIFVVLFLVEGEGADASCAVDMAYSTVIVRVCRRVVEGGVTTVASVTEQNKIKSEKIYECSYYEVYSISTTSFVPPHALRTPQLHSISTTNL